MRGWLILVVLGSLFGGALAYLLRPGSSDLDRLYEQATRERPTIEQALNECGDLVHYFSERKWTERKKDELADLRRRFEDLEKAARVAHDDEKSPRAERMKTLTKLGGHYSDLRLDATDLRARLREMKRYDELLKPLIAELGRNMIELEKAQSTSTDSDFSIRVGKLLDDSRRSRKYAEEALQALSVKIREGQVLGDTARNELDSLNKRMKELLESPHR